MLLAHRASDSFDSLKKSYSKPRQHKRYHFANIGPYSQSFSFSSSHVRMWELEHREGWVPKNGGFQTVMLEKTLESPNSKDDKQVNPKGNQPWTFIGMTDAEAPIFWPPDVKTWLSEKDPDAGKDWGQREMVMTEDETIGWHHLNGHES